MLYRSNKNRRVETIEASTREALKKEATEEANLDDMEE
jgi:hypothetical protein